jgi:coenzyme F420-0:L-glutamate ligase/coenzyme F420-1:gamma-L-glutamate ligase
MNKSHAPDKLELTALRDFPLVQTGDKLPELIGNALRANNLRPMDHDVLVVAQKIVSKAEGRSVLLSEVMPSEEARRRATETGKDPRLVELILRESTEVLRQGDKLIITENRLGLVMANAGIDQSNVDAGCALLLPQDPDRSASDIRAHIKEEFDVDVGVIVADSIGRAWRNGVIGHAIGVAGIKALLDLRRVPDLNNQELRVTDAAIADEIAAAASLLMGQAAEGKPVVLVRGFKDIQGASTAKSLLRPKEQDLFR